MKKLLIFTVFYPGAETYIEEFFDSLKIQSRKDFDLLIVNDGYKDSHLQELCPELTIIELDGVNRISTNREIGINYAIQKKYDYLMFCDVDDYFKPIRVESSLEAIISTDIVVNDLDIVNAKRKVLLKNYFSKSIDEKTKINIEFIRDKNIFGFSNTTLQIAKLKEVSFPEDLRIVDWYYFTNLLQQGLKVKYISDSLTEYRQHSDNMIGITTCTLDAFKNLLKLKKKHYSYFLANPIYKKMYDEMLQIEVLSDLDMEYLLIKNEKQTPYPLWWQNVKLN